MRLFAGQCLPHTYMNKHLHEYLNTPVNLCHQTKQPRDLSGKDTRYYVYKFTSNGQYFSGDASGVLCRLTKSYRRLVLARDYDLIIRNENLRKTRVLFVSMW